MKILVLAVLLAATSARAVELSSAPSEPPAAAPPAEELAILDGVWTGRFDWAAPPAYGAWQSLTSIDQATGFSKRLWTLAKDGRPVLNVGIFAGMAKPVSEPATPLRPLAGLTLAVPGSLLDWVLGTHWGAAWLPKLKTGLLLADDLTRPTQLHLRPSFTGVGVSYALGAP